MNLFETLKRLVHCKICVRGHLIRLSNILKSTQDLLIVTNTFKISRYRPQ